MSLVRKITKPKNRSDRWRSPSHLSHVRKHACAVCDSETNIEAAHVRMNSDAGLGRKPSDWFALPLCGGPNSNREGQLGCHNRQHIVGEPTFWATSGKDPFAIMEDLIQSSPRRAEIKAERAARQ